eukprot:4986532-Prymnesium_polylepis.1
MLQQVPLEARPRVVYAAQLADKADGGAAGLGASAARHRRGAAAHAERPHAGRQRAAAGVWHRVLQRPQVRGETACCGVTLKLDAKAGGAFLEGAEQRLLYLEPDRLHRVNGAERFYFCSEK